MFRGSTVIMPELVSDLTNNGYVDADDLFVLLAEWTGPDPNPPAEAALGAAAVPEPSAFVLALLATLGMGFYRRRRQRAF